MSFRRFWAMARKEFLHVLRDPNSLALAIALPVLMLTLFGYALTLDVDDVPLIVWDQSGTAQSRDLVSRFAGSRYFSLRGSASSYAEIERAIDERTAMVALVIPRDFARWLDSGRIASAQLIVDGSDSNTATLAIGYAEAVTLTYSTDAAVQDFRRSGLRVLEMPLDVRPRVWFNEVLESRNFIIPGLIAVIMMVIAALLTSLTVAREWEHGTMEQLISTPVKPAELVLGKLLPYFAIGLFDVLLAVLMGVYLFHVPLRGSVVLLFATAAIFLIGTLSLGMFISVVTKQQMLATQLAMVLTFLPSFLLSGFMFPLANMPAVVRAASRVIPARYFIAILKGVYLKGTGLEILQTDVLLLSAFSVVMVALTIARFKKRMA